MKKITSSIIFFVVSGCLIYSCSKNFGSKNETNNALTSNANGTADPYIVKVNGKSSNSIFTSQEMKGFLATGKASYLGQIKTWQLTKDRSIKFILKANTSVILLKKNGQVEFTEFSGDLAPIALEGDDNGSYESSPLNRCKASCDLAWLDCYYDEDFPVTEPDNAANCERWLEECYKHCNENCTVIRYSTPFTQNITIKYQ